MKVAGHFMKIGHKLKIYESLSFENIELGTSKSQSKWQTKFRTLFQAIKMQ